VHGGRAHYSEEEEDVTPVGSKRAPSSTALLLPPKRHREEEEEEEELSEEEEEEEEEDDEPTKEDLDFLASDNEEEEGGDAGYEEVEERMDTNIRRKVKMSDDEFVEYYEQKWATLNDALERKRITQGQFRLQAAVLKLQEQEEHKRRAYALKRKARTPK
jgi:hypothetical protein